MKKTLCILFAAMMIICTAAAESLDLSSMTLEELKTLRDRIDTEIASRNQVKDNEVILETDDLKLVVTSTKIVQSEYTGDYILTVYMDWTNLASSPKRLNSILGASAYADGVGISCSTSNFNTEIRSGITYGVSVYCFVPPEASKVDIDITSWLKTTVYSTMTFSMR